MHFLSTLFTAVALLFLPSQLFGQVIESHDIRDLLKHADADTLVVLDVNGVLMHPAQDLGSQDWAWQEVDRRVASGLTLEQAIDDLLPQLQRILVASDAVPVESTTLGVIRRLQKEKVTILGLTSANIELAYSTHDKLHSLGIHLERNRIVNNHVEVTGPYAAKYIEGIVFAGVKYDKGTVLFRFLDQIGYVPKKIVFVDDSRRKMAAMEIATTERGIPFTGLYYKAPKESYDPQVAKKQLELFGRLLSDEEAALLLEGGK
jgi:hypothetical protein